MSPEAETELPAPPRPVETMARTIRNRGLRLALAVTVGLTLEVIRGSALPMLAPVIALQLLAGSMRPPPLPMLLLLLAVSAFASALAWFVSVLSVNVPGAYAVGVGLLYLWGFALAFTPRMSLIGVMIVTMTVVVTSLATVSTGVALGVVVELVGSVFMGSVLVYFVHGCFPTPDDADVAAAAPKAPATPRFPAAPRAVMATVVLLPLHLYLNSDGLAAMVTLLTTATMLRQPGIAESTRYFIGYAAGNAIGGLLAGVSAFVTLAHEGLMMLVATVAATSLIFAWKVIQAERWAPILLPGFVAYVVLYGLALSPLTPAGHVEVGVRVLQIVAAAVYVFGAVSLLLPLLRRLLGPGPAPAA